uniref:G-protein coupled receptors family 1 profile domain-containing protein n=1 Tax=Timema bartmani TaxID=61472 RepID=A0A7R9EPE4_9NEOP|nr:unnamed protein product [Timema bartmani]
MKAYYEVYSSGSQTVGRTISPDVLYWHDTTRFYGTNGMCFPLHIDNPFFLGWEYSAFIFLGLNMTSLALIAVLYIGMFASICYTRKNTPITNLGDMEFAVRFFFIVLTDAGCWAPIIVLKLLAIERFDISPDLYAWVVVFILPVNSAVNPLLYTFTTSKYRNQLAALSWSFWSKRTTFGRRKSSADTETSRSSSHRNIVSYTKGKRLSQDLPCAVPILDPIKSVPNSNWGISTARSGSEESETVPESCEEKITDIVLLQGL